MSMNNIIPAWLILDQIKQEQLSREEYLEWLRSEAEKQPHDPMVRARLEAEKAGMERFTFHDLRAKAGSDAADWRLLGHTDRATFERIYNRAPVRIVNTTPVVNKGKGCK